MRPLITTINYSSVMADKCGKIKNSGLIQNNTKMENCRYSFIQIILHIISLLGAVVAFYLLFQCNYYYCMGTSDSSDIIIPTLSILVTLLVGWNIYSALGIESRFKEALSEQKQREKE